MNHLFIESRQAKAISLTFSPFISGRLTSSQLLKNGNLLVPLSPCFFAFRAFLRWSFFVGVSTVTFGGFVSLNSWTVNSLNEDSEKMKYTKDCLEFIYALTYCRTLSEYICFFLGLPFAAIKFNLVNSFSFLAFNALLWRYNAKIFLPRSISGRVSDLMIIN